MSYIAGMLLLQMSHVDAFICFANMLEIHFFASLFKMDLVELRKHIGIYEIHQREIKIKIKKKNIVGAQRKN